MTGIAETKLLIFAHSAKRRATEYEHDIAPTRSPYSARNAAELIMNELIVRLDACGEHQHIRRGQILKAFAAASLAFSIYDNACDALPF